MVVLRHQRQSAPITNATPDYHDYPDRYCNMEYYSPPVDTVEDALAKWQTKRGDPEQAAQIYESVLQQFPQNKKAKRS